METSAKTGIGVDDAFLTLTSLIIQQKQRYDNLFRANFNISNPSSQLVSENQGTEVSEHSVTIANSSQDKKEKRCCS